MVFHVVHVADGGPGHARQVDVRGEDEVLPGIAAAAAVVDGGGQVRQLIRRSDLPGIRFRAAAAGKGGFLRQGGQAQAGQRHGQHAQQRQDF